MQTTQIFSASASNNVGTAPIPAQTTTTNSSSLRALRAMQTKNPQIWQDDLNMDLRVLLARGKEPVLALLRPTKSASQLLALTKARLLQQSSQITPQQRARNAYELQRQGVDCEHIQKMLNEQKLAYAHELKEKRNEVLSEFHIAQLKGCSVAEYVDKYTKFTMLSQADQLTKNSNSYCSDNNL